jgi:predicted nucleotidyltransferase
METIVLSITKELKLDDDQITNIYNYGSWVYGTNHEKSDRDFLFILKSKNGKRLKFKKDFDYFHSFELHCLKNCDVTIHTCENFELLLEKNYMLAVECLFYPDEFILRNNIDYKTIYLSKYYNPFRLTSYLL